MGGGIARHVTDSGCDTIAHAYYSQLRYRVLLEELPNKGFGIRKRQEVPGGTKVFLDHGNGHVEDEDEVADDASLEGCSVLE